MAREITENWRVENIDTSQLEYTAATIFKYGTICIGAISIYAAIIYLFAKQLRKD